MSEASTAGAVDGEAAIDVAGIVLEALLCATPEPPPVTTDPSEVITLGESMTAARALILDDVASRGLGRIPVGEHAERLSILRDRDTRWNAALVRAKHQLAERMSSISRLSRVRYG